MNLEELARTAQALIAPGKGILAADESFPTIEKRFKAVQVASTQENRRAYREMLFSTPGLGEFISGTILFDETIRDRTGGGEPMPALLQRQRIIPGIKVDKGAKPMALFPSEKVTSGLDGLRERFAEYRELGARFSKWRAVISIGPARPSATCLRSNADALGRFAALSQEADLVPIVEPEVLMDGNHSLERCEEATQQALMAVFASLFEHRVQLEGMLLKPNMVTSGKDAPSHASVQEVADATVRCLRRTVPPAVPGVVFLSGGQNAELATEHLNAMNQINNLPWAVSFSYGRALQDPALNQWRGSNVEAGQRALYHRAKCNSLARFGRYSAELEQLAMELAA